MGETGQIVHVRLLKCEHDDREQLSFVYTLTTDLGDATWPAAVELVARCGEATQKLRWSGTAGVQKGKLTSRSKKGTLSLSSASAVGCSSIERLTQTSWIDGALILACHADVTDSGRATSQTRKLQIGKQRLCIEESLGESIESHVWDGGLQLAALLASVEISIPKGKRVIELGSGTGLVGLTLAALGYDVLLTDLARASDIVLGNVKLNNSAAAFEVLDWFARETDLRADMLVMADVTYNADSHDMLMDTIRRLSRPGTQIAFASKYRHADELVFMTRLCDAFACSTKLRVRDVDVLMLTV